MSIALSSYISYIKMMISKQFPVSSSQAEVEKLFVALQPNILNDEFVGYILFSVIIYQYMIPF